jgi:hypothetical protein
MTVRQVELSDFGRVLGEFTSLHIKDIKHGVASGVARSISDLVAASPVDTGLYAQSWNFTVDEEKVILGNYAPHAPIIEFGARPFTPPLKPLLEWAKRVLKDSSQPPNYSPAVQGLARYTQKKIQAEGMQPRHILTNMLPKIMENIREELRRGAS